MPLRHRSRTPSKPDPEPVPTTSSVPAEIPEEQETLFRQVLTLLQDNRIPLAVAGAFALRQHTGICRFTKDLDLFMTAENSRRALDCLCQAGFECAVPDPVWLAKAHKDDFFVDLITGMSNGVINVEDSWVDRSRPAVVHGIETRVLAPEELVASKLFVAKRERFDGADIAHIIYGTNGDFDWNRVLQLAGEHWELLLWNLMLFRYVYPAQTHYVPDQVWDALLSRFQTALSDGNSDGSFRGSLLDENMFAIDVNEWRLPNLFEECRGRRLAQIQQIAKPCESGK